MVFPFFYIVGFIGPRMFNKRFLKIRLVLLSFWVFHYILVANKVEKGRVFRLSCVVLLIVIIIFFLTEKSITFYVFFELRLIPTLIMVFLFGYQPEKLQASMYLLLYTVFSSLPLLLVFIRNNLYMRHMGHINVWWYVTVITLGFRVKTPLYIVHVWLPKAHVEAPVAGSIVLAGVLLKLGRYGFIIFCPRLHNTILIIYVYLSILGAIYCSIVCLRNYDMKSLIAYRSVVHIGVVTIGVVRGFEIGYKRALIIVIAHGVCSPFLFFLAYYFYCASHSRVISCNKGLVSFPMAIISCFLLLAINMGVPPTINLWREVFMFVTLVEFIKYSIFFLFVIAFLGVIYNFFIYVRISQRKESFFVKIETFLWPFLNSMFLSFALFLIVNLFLIMEKFEVSVYLNSQSSYFLNLIRSDEISGVTIKTN